MRQVNIHIKIESFNSSTVIHPDGENAYVGMRRKKKIVLLKNDFEEFQIGHKFGPLTVSTAMAVSPEIPKTTAFFEPQALEDVEPLQKLNKNVSL